MKKIYLFGFALLMIVLPYRAGAVMQSLNGLTGQNQTFANDTNLMISSSGTNHTLGWNGLLSPARGGLGVNASGFATGAIPFFDSSSFGSDTDFSWNTTTNSLDLGGNLNMNGEIFATNLNLGDGAVIAFNSGQPNEVNLFHNDGRLALGNVEGSTVNFDVSQITPNNEKTFTFPDSSGTFSLTSDLDSYVPYTGAISSLDMGGLDITASTISGQQLQVYRNGDITFYSDAGTTQTGNLAVQNAGVYSFLESAGSFLGNLDFNGIDTSDKTFTFPNASGTFSLLESNQNFSGINTFSNPVNNFISSSDSTVHIGADGVPGCLVMGDSDSSGVTYITVNDGVMDISVTKPSNCN